MKRFILSVVVWLLLSGTAVAGTEVRGVGDTTGKDQATLFVRPFCKFGLQFLAVTIRNQDNNYGYEDNVEVIQVLSSAGSSGFPMKCQEDAREPVVRYK